MTFYAVQKTWFYDDYKRADGGGYVLNLFKTEQKAIEYAKKKMVEYINENCLVFESHQFKLKHWSDHGIDLNGIEATPEDIEEYNSDMQRSRYDLPTYNIGTTNPNEIKGPTGSTGAIGNTGPNLTREAAVKVWILYKDIVKQPATEENLGKLRALKIALEGEAQYTFNATNEDFTVVELEALDEEKEVKIVITEPTDQN